MVCLQLEAGSAVVEIDAGRGGRLSALSVDGRPLLFNAGSASLQWGAYPMVPWAGRVADGRFRFGDREFDLPRNLPPHSAHGIGFLRSWEVVDTHTLGLDLDSPWPFGGRVEQTFELEPDQLTMTMAVTAAVDMPVMVGWHPWFHRFLGRADGPPVEARIGFEPGAMYELDDRAIPTGRLVTPPPGPWDNCFTRVDGRPTITWPDLVTLELSSSCDHWVVYDQPGHAVCVEPQSAAPDVFNREAPVLGAGERLEAWFRMAWS